MSDSMHEQGICSEEMQFAAVIVGPAQVATWRGGARQADFFDGKVLAQTIRRRASYWRHRGAPDLSLRFRLA